MALSLLKLILTLSFSCTFGDCIFKCLKKLISCLSQPFLHFASKQSSLCFGEMEGEVGINMHKMWQIKRRESRCTYT